jgi:hypothetical protein
MTAPEDVRKLVPLPALAASRMVLTMFSAVWIAAIESTPRE